MHVLIVQQDYDIPDAYGPFETVPEAQAYAEEYRRRAGIDHLAEATPENNEAWTELGWLFAIREVRSTRNE